MMEIAVRKQDEVKRMICETVNKKKEELIEKAATCDITSKFTVPVMMTIAMTALVMIALISRDDGCAERVISDKKHRRWSSW